MPHILIIEDDKATRYQLSKLLTLGGYDVSEACDGIDGIEKSNTIRPDLIVCDILMPRLDGYGVLMHMRENPKTRLIPFIFLTAKSQIKDLRKGMELGADDYLTKPVCSEGLFNSIQRRLERRAHQLEETERLKDELDLELAKSMPGEIEETIQRIVSYSNLVSLKFSETDSQASEICESLNREVVSIRRYIRRIDLFNKLPKLYANRFSESMLSLATRTADPTVAAEAAHFTAQRHSRLSDLEISLPKRPLPIDSEYLEVLIDELVSNALESSPEDTPVQLGIRSDHGLLSISVHDQGAGMDHDALQKHRSFSKFGQIDQSGQRLCIGLPLVQGLARLHGGELNLTNEPEGGFTAQVFLPELALSQTGNS